MRLSYCTNGYLLCVIADTSQGGRVHNNMESVKLSVNIVLHASMSTVHELMKSRVDV